MHELILDFYAREILNNTAAGTKSMDVWVSLSDSWPSFQRCISSLLMSSSLIIIRYDPTIGIAPQPNPDQNFRSLLASDLPLLRQRTHTQLPALLMDNPTSCHSPTPPDKKNTVAYGQHLICAPMHSCLFTTLLAWILSPLWIISCRWWTWNASIGMTRAECSPSRLLPVTNATWKILGKYRVSKG